MVTLTLPDNMAREIERMAAHDGVTPEEFIARLVEQAAVEDAYAARIAGEEAAKATARCLDELSLNGKP